MPATSFGERAVEAIRKHPALFDALLEFEKTGKLPKMAYRERINLTIDGTLLRKFRRRCKEQGFNMSRIVEKHIKEELGKRAEY